jgi:hypothetical protein
MKYKFHLLLLMTILFLGACKKDENIQPVIDPNFQEYVDRFLAEASARGISIDIKRLKVSSGDTLTYSCGYGNPMDVVISSNCWQTYNDINKELLLFHELGHAVLNRPHDNSTLLNGDFKSMMCSTPHTYLYNETTPERREYYLDELFNPHIASPSWVIEKTKPTILFKDTISAVKNSWEYIKGPDNNFQGEFCSSVFFSPGTSLSIKSDTPIGYAYWNYDYIPLGINQSDRLVLRVNIKLDAVNYGGGATIIISGVDDKDTRIFYAYKTIHGTTDFMQYSVVLPYYFASVKKIHIHLVLDRSTGTAYFDEIELIKYE